VVFSSQGGGSCPDGIPDDADCDDADLDLENRVGVSLLNHVDFSDPRCARYADAIVDIVNQQDLWGFDSFEDGGGDIWWGFTHDGSERIGIARDIEDDEFLAYVAIHEGYHVTDGLGDDGGWNEEMLAHGWAETCTGYEVFD
jgi:hypothetical protein